MRVIDTSAWIEWLVGTPLGRSLGRDMPSRDTLVVPTIVQLELSKWLLREVGEAEADRVIAYTRKGVVVALDTDIALRAAELHRRYGLATADAVIYATAQISRADLLTCDAHFEGLPDVVYFAKTS